MAKQIYYIDYYIEEKNCGNIGFLRVALKQIEVVLRNIPICGRVERNLYLMGNVQETKIQIGKIVLQDGMGQERVDVSKEEWWQNNILYVPISNNSYGICQIKSDVSIIQNVEKEKEQRKESNFEQPNEMDYVSKAEPIIEDDKWRQIYKSYPTVHIFPQKQSVLIKPKDMILLHSGNHDLAGNSFLVHAYYNYRQLLLIRDETEQYYIGVPGVYYERESQLAAMYGFVDFVNGESRLENGNPRQNYAGCFVYYIKRVEI